MCSIVALNFSQDAKGKKKKYVSLLLGAWAISQVIQKGLTSFTVINFGCPLEINLDPSVVPSSQTQKQHQIYMKVAVFLT